MKVKIKHQLTLKEAKSQLKDVEPLFQGCTFKFLNVERNIQPRISIQAGRYSGSAFLCKHESLISAAISAFSMLQYKQGEAAGISRGMEMKASEIRYALNIFDETKD